MDAFYAAVEQRNNPELQGKPVVVGGDPDRRGVVSTCSYEARKYGIHSAMPSSQARRLCPNAVFVRGNFEQYRQVSREINRIFNSYTHLVEPLSLDEAFLDVTENLRGEPSATRMAREIKNRIKEECNLTASAGVSYNKFLAKVASDWQKPDGLTVIIPEKAQEFIEQLEVRKFFGVGPATEKRMHQLGIYTGVDLKQHSLQQLTQWFGKAGTFFYQIARGIDERDVNPVRERKSVGREVTLASDITGSNEIESLLKQLAEQVMERYERVGKSARTVTLKVRYDDFTTISRSHTGGMLINTMDQVVETCRELLEQTEAGTRPVRLLGISLSGFPSEEDDVLGQDWQLEFPFDDSKA